jgi:glutamyl-tRNA synthetase
MFTREQMIEHFSLERVNRSPASFDPQKLLAFQERWMQALSVEARVSRVLPFVEGIGLVDSPPTDPQRARVADVVRAAGERLKVAGDILDYPEFFQPDADVAYDEKAFTKRVRKEGIDTRLRRFRGRLANVDPFDVLTLDQAMHDFVDTEGIGIGQIIHAVRVAVTGKAVGFGLFEGLAILGREACLARIDRALARLPAVGETGSA